MQLPGVKGSVLEDTATAKGACHSCFARAVRSLTSSSGLQDMYKEFGQRDHDGAVRRSKLTLLRVSAS